jgi:sigma-B regulation protein RsbU (phosphoserine phosphatase)
LPSLCEYLTEEMLRQLPEALSSVAGRPVRVVCADGSAYSPGADGASGAGPDSARGQVVPILVGPDQVGQLELVDAGQGRLPGGEAERDTRWAGEFLSLIAQVIGHLCQREQLLRSRAQDLAMLYQLTAEFTGQRDLESLLQLVARTVVEIMGAKGCMIRLLNEDRTELIAAAVAGLSEAYLKKGPIRLDRSRIDQEVMRTKRTVYVQDQRNDPRVLYPLEARGEGIVSSLCAPMIYSGRVEGILRVYTGQVHQFNWFETALLEAIAAQAAAAIVNARLYREAVEGEQMRRQLTLAGEVQREMIPNQPPEIPGYDIGAIYVPSYQLSGDFYDFITLAEGNFGLAVADIVGKGVRASLLMASIRASLRAHATNIYDMSTVMRKVNRDLCADSLISDFATMFYGVLDTQSQRLTYSNAGHTPPILVRNGHTLRLTTGGTVLGIESGIRYSTEAFDLKSGDVILAYTDGLPEATNFRDECFGNERVADALAEAVEMDLSGEGIVRHVLWMMRKFAGLQRRFDDLTLVAVRVL